ncbi:BnaC04g01410D [Brassica napus]|nr:BnaC04g01410D [Brassica napus]
MVELRSSSDEISTNPNQTKSVKLKGRRKPNPKTELGNQKSARQSKERLYPSGSRPTTAELTKPPPLGDRNRRRQSWRNLCLLETKPSSRTMSFTALSSTRPRLYARDRSAMCGLVPELKQNGGERKRERSENQQLYK